MAWVKKDLCLNCLISKGQSLASPIIGIAIYGQHRQVESCGALMAFNKIYIHYHSLLKAPI